MATTYEIHYADGTTDTITGSLDTHVSTIGYAAVEIVRARRRTMIPWSQVVKVDIISPDEDTDEEAVIERVADVLDNYLDQLDGDDEVDTRDLAENIVRRIWPVEGA